MIVSTPAPSRHRIGRTLDSATRKRWIELGVWVERNRRVPSAEQIREIVGCSEKPARKARHSIAEILGVRLQQGGRHG